MGVEVVVGYLVGWCWRKARKVAGRADEAVDDVLAAGVDRLRDVVVRKLEGDAALERLAEEAGSDLEEPQVSERTKRRVKDALEEAMEADPEFAAAVEKELAGVEAARVAGAVSAGEYGIAVGGDVHIKAETGGVAAQVIHGSVSMGNPPAPGTGQA